MAADAGLELHEKLLELIGASWISQALHAAVELELPDRLAAGASSRALALATGAHEPSLRRLLRALVTLEICHEREDGSFALTELGELLRSDAPGSLAAWTRWSGGALWPVWGRLADSVRSGQSARALLSGTHGFEHLDGDAASAALFHRALGELTRLAAVAVTESYDFGRFRRVVDVGGGYGELLAAILTRWPATRGVLLERAHAVEGARQRLSQAGLDERCEVVAGDFFEAIPPGADAYVLKSVLHDWNDADAARLLRTCRNAMSPEARLVVIERVLPGRLRPDPRDRSHARSDLLMLAAHGAKERSVEEFSALLGESGFDLGAVQSVALGLSVLEALPR